MYRLCIPGSFTVKSVKLFKSGFFIAGWCETNSLLSIKKIISVEVNQISEEVFNKGFFQVWWWWRVLYFYKDLSKFGGVRSVLTFKTRSKYVLLDPNMCCVIPHYWVKSLKQTIFDQSWISHNYVDLSNFRYFVFFK